MPEVPVGYFPDVGVRFGAVPSTNFETEIERDPHSGREQRRGRSVSGGLRAWRGETVHLDQAKRRIVADFLHARRGQLQSFYFFAPDAREVVNASVGSVNSATRIIIPYRRSSITEVRIGTSSVAFSVTPLVPRDGTYATLRFDGVASYVDCGSSATLRPTGDLTLSAWVRRMSAANGAVFSNYSADASGIELYVSGTSIVFRTGRSGATSTVTANVNLQLAVWTHLACVLSGTTLSIYKDGALHSTHTGVQPALAATIAAKIGSASVGAFSGTLSDVRLYDVALSAAEVGAVYAGTAAGQTNLRGLWPLTAGTGTTADDLSAYGNNGTLVNSPVWCAGEDEITFTAGAQSGAVTVSLTGRPRVIVRSTRDAVVQALLQNVTDVLAAFPIELVEPGA